MLLKADEGMTDRDIASGLLIGRRVRTRFVRRDSTAHSMSALDRDRSASWTADSKHIEPSRHADWTIQLLADKVVAMGFAARQVLVKPVQ